MKNIILFGVAAMGLLFASSACKKKTTTKPTGVVICKVNGKNWQSASSSTTYTDKYKTLVHGVDAFIKGDTVLSIQGNLVNGSDSSMVYLYFRLKTPVVGFYGGVGTAKYACVYADGFDIDHVFGAVLGFNTPWSVEITAYDKAAKKISGKFNFTMTPKSAGTTYTITEGEFTDLILK
jgi:hypothetical protein